MYYCAIPSGLFHAPAALGPWLNPHFFRHALMVAVRPPNDSDLKTNKHVFFGNALHFPGQQKSRLIFRNALYSPWSLCAALPAPYFNLPLPWPHWALGWRDGTVCMARTSMSWVWLWPLWPAAHYVEANGTAPSLDDGSERTRSNMVWLKSYGRWWLTITILHTLVTTRYNPRYPNDWSRHS